MTTHNPYSPPASNIKVNQNRMGKNVFVVLVIVHLLVTLILASNYIELVRIGAARAIGLLLLGPACIGLYLGTIFLILRGKGKYLFIFSTIGLALASPTWWPTLGSYPIFFGTLLGIFGWWLSRNSSNVSRSDR